MRSFKIKDDKQSSTTLPTSPCTGAATKKNSPKQRCYALRKYALIVLCLLATVCMSVGFSKWNIHIQQTLTVGDNDKTPLLGYVTENTASPENVILNRYLTVEHSTVDASGGETKQTTKVEDIGKNSFTYNGKPFSVSVSDLTAADVAATWDNWDITFACTYYTKTGTGSTTAYSPTSDSGKTAPTNAGTYICVVTAQSESDPSVDNGTAISNLNFLTNPATNTKNSCAAVVEFTVAPQQITAPRADVNKVYTYTGSEQTFELSDFDSDKMKVSGDKATNAGNYTVTVSLTDKTNYVWYDIPTTDTNNTDKNGKNEDLTFEWTIQKATIAKPTLAQTEFEYTGNPIDVTSQLIGYDSDKMTASGDTTATNANSYTATIKIKDDYYKNYKWSDSDNQSYTISWSIKTVALTISVDTPDEIVKGDPVPTFSATFTGLVGNDKESDFTLNYTCSYTTTSEAGSYTVSVKASGDKVDNYNIAYVDATLTVTANATISAPTYDGKSSLTYNGSNRDLTSLLQGFDSDTMSATGYSQKNKGQYNVKITPKDTYTWKDGEQKGTNNAITFILPINAKTIVINDYAIDFSSTQSWQAMHETLKTYYSNDICTSDKSSVYVVTTELTNNVFTYTYNGGYSADFCTGYSEDNFGTDTTYLLNNFVGSTYLGTLSLSGDTNGNYELSSKTYYLKYKTASVGTTLYTIEDAITLNSTDSIILKGGDTYVMTCFTALDYYNSTKTYTLSNKNLIVPYKEGATESEINISTVGTNTVYSVLFIPSTVTFNLETQINITAYVYSTPSIGRICETYQRGVIVNSGTIDVDSGGSIISYGYLKGKGIIKLNSNATIIDLLSAYNFMSAAVANAVKSKNVFPISSYTIHNISCRTNIYYGATYKAYYALEASNNAYDGYITLMSNTTDALFQLTNENKNGETAYIEKYTEKANNWTSTSNYGKALTRIIESNQIEGQREVVNLHYADVQDNPISITIKTTLGKAEMKTSPQMACPISFMHINAYNYSTLTFKNSSYKFLAGTSLNIEETSKLNVNEGINVSFLTTTQSSKICDWGNYGSTFIPVDNNDSIIVVNGTANIFGSISGSILSHTAGAELNITTNSIDTTVITYIDIKYNGLSSTVNTTPLATMYATGNVFTSGNCYTLNDTLKKTTTYISVNVKDGENTIYAWYPDVDNYTITYETGFDDVKVTPDQYAPATEITTFPTPTKLGYKFKGWLLDGKLITTPVTFYTDVTLTADWEETTYTIQYKYVYDDCTATEVGSPTITATTTFKVTDGVISGKLELVKNYNNIIGYRLTGWYVDENCSTEIDTAYNLLTKTQSLNEAANTINVYGVWKTYTPSFTVEFATGIGTEPNGVDYNEVTVEVSSQSTWQPTKNYASYETATAQEYYFGGWYTDVSCTTAFSGFTANQYSESETVTLYAKWIQKKMLTITNNAPFTITNATINVNDTDTSLGTINQNDSVTLYYLENTVVKVGDLTYVATSISTNENDYHIYVANWNNSNITMNDNQSLSINGTDTVYYKTTITVTEQGKSSSVTINFSTDTPAYDTAFNKITTSTQVTGSVAYYLQSGKSYSVTKTEIESGNDTITVTSGGTTINYEGKSVSCLVEGTLITLADGSKKKVEDLLATDVLLAFNHETGLYVAAPLLANVHGTQTAEICEVITLTFANGKKLEIVAEHGLYDKDLNKYVYLNAYNANDFIGHNFVTSEYVNNTVVSSITKLVNVTITNKYTRYYNPATVWHINIIANDMLTLSAGMVNLFAYDENMKYDELLMQQDIAKYGLYTYEDFKNYTSEEVFNAFPFKYYKVAVGKGEFTFEKLLWLLDFYNADTTIKPSFDSSNNSDTDAEQGGNDDSSLLGINSGGAEDNSSVPAAKEATFLPTSSSSKTKFSSSSPAPDDDTQ